MSLCNKTSQDEFLTCLDQKLKEKLGPMSRVMDSLTESISFMSEKFDLLIKRIDSLDMKCNDVESENKCLKAEISSLSQSMRR